MTSPHTVRYSWALVHGLRRVLYEIVGDRVHNRRMAEVFYDRGSGKIVTNVYDTDAYNHGVDKIRQDVEQHLAKLVAARMNRN